VELRLSVWERSFSRRKVIENADGEGDGVNGGGSDVLSGRGHTDG